ncbi:MAG: permease-like cell division protein FtsX [Candidatus Saccharibacteria bacterium]
MKPRTVPYFFREASISLARNRILSIATATTVAVCIFILGIALLLYFNTGYLVGRLESNVEIVAFLENNISNYSRETLLSSIRDLPGVRSVQLVSKDEALKSLETRLGGDYSISETLGGDNPLPDSIKIKAKDPRQVAKIADLVSKMEGVNKIRFGQAFVNKLVKVSDWARLISLAIVVFLAFAAVFLVATTIRLTIFSRRKEIYIMKLVGATDWFIRLPFFIEGIILALTGTAFAVLCLALGYNYLIDSLRQAVAFIPLLSGGQVIIDLYLGLVIAGILLGILGTFISVNKFLDV